MILKLETPNLKQKRSTRALSKYHILWIEQVKKNQRYTCLRLSRSTSMPATTQLKPQVCSCTIKVTGFLETGARYVPTLVL